MLSLSYKLDNSIEIGKDTYLVNLSFDNVLRFIDMINDEELSTEYKITLGLRMLLGVSFLIPIDAQYYIFDQIYQKFICKSNEEVIETDRQGNPLPKKYEKDKENNYSLKHDAPYIYASFFQAYGIDLIDQQGKLHWEKFQALLSGLPKDTKFKEVIEIRTWTPYKNCPAEEKKHMKELQKVYKLPEEGGEDLSQMEE
ncbi:Gp15 family bacteriophage protein [uncultured Enterococcus sp.]|uniref:Gp15 family bacteriophage protein n=1 Tax=uncultured Enterococcus sp. TaxID=167972 RepID=UPI002AA61DE0|nr:Gp15 family bacteriophage protein [uncultured Enterococcus sp.]